MLTASPLSVCGRARGLPLAGLARGVPAAGHLSNAVDALGDITEADHARTASPADSQGVEGPVGAGGLRQSQRPADSLDWSPSQLLKYREAFAPTLIVRAGKIFINTSDMTFGKISVGCTD